MFGISIHCIFLLHIYLLSFVICPCVCFVFVKFHPLFLNCVTWCMALDCLSMGLCLSVAFVFFFFCTELLEFGTCLALK
jgi:hypothetical protein